MRAPDIWQADTSITRRHLLAWVGWGSCATFSGGILAMVCFFQRPVVCLEEASKQLVAETWVPIPATPGKLARSDDEYERKGTANLCMAFEPLAGQRQVQGTERRTAVDCTHVSRDLVDVHYPQADTIVLVMDHLNTHKPASLYEAFAPAEAQRLLERLGIHHTPKHRSGLNMAETALSVLAT